MVMRINPMILLQVAIAAAAGVGVIYLQRHISGPTGGMVPALLGFLIAWLVMPAVSYDIEITALAGPSFLMRR